MKTKINMNWIETRNNVSVTLCLNLWCVLHFRTSPHQVFKVLMKLMVPNCERHQVFCLLLSSKMAFCTKSIVFLFLFWSHVIPLSWDTNTSVKNSFVLIVKFENISHLDLVFLLLTLKKWNYKLNNNKTHTSSYQ